MRHRPPGPVRSGPAGPALPLPSPCPRPRPSSSSPALPVLPALSAPAPALRPESLLFEAPLSCPAAPSLRPRPALRPESPRPSLAEPRYPVLPAPPLPVCPPLPLGPLPLPLGPAPPLGHAPPGWSLSPVQPGAARPAPSRRVFTPGASVHAQPARPRSGTFGDGGAAETGLQGQEGGRRAAAGSACRAG